MTQKTTHQGRAVPLPLASEFPEATQAQWEAAALQSLRGKSLSELVSYTLDDIAIDVLYQRTDRNEQSLDRFPFTRSGPYQSRIESGLTIRQVFDHPSPAINNQLILDELNRGVTAVHLSLSDAAKSTASLTDSTPFTGQGIEIYALQDLNDALKDVYLDLASISFDSGAAFTQSANMLQQLWAARGLTGTQCKAAFNADPLGTLAKTGEYPTTVQQSLNAVAALALSTQQHFPSATAVAVNTSIYHDNGASSAQELGILLATGKTYLQVITENGLSIDAACRQIEAQISVDTDYFQSTAKLRSARQLWSHMARACGASPNNTALTINARTSQRMQTRNDPWVNILRTTVATTAAAIGGADSVTVAPFDSELASHSALGRRIARNIPIIVQEESGLNKVIDPMGGSGYLESLTRQLCEKAWTCFQTIEKHGGLASSLKANSLQAMLDATHQRRLHAIGHGELPIVGVSEFPIIEQAAVQPDAQLLSQGLAARTQATTRAISQARTQATTKATSHAATPQQAAESVTAMPIRRLSEPFEVLRSAIDELAEHCGTRPSVYVAVLGMPAEYLRRVQHLRNQLAIAGLLASEPTGEQSVSSVIENYQQSASRVVIVCSGKNTDDTEAAELVAKLKTTGAETVVFAGPPATADSLLSKASIDIHMYHGGNVLEALTQIGRAIGAKV